MAIDEVVLTAHSRGEAPHTLRFLQFQPHCTLVGYHQAVEQEIRIDYCREHGIDINRRLTGGGGLYWDPTALGWEIYAPQGHPGIPVQVEAMYELLCQAAVRGLARLGVEARFRPQNDIEVEGRKISGTGGTALGGSFMFQGSLLVDFDVDTMLRALRIPTEKLKDKEIDSVKERVTCLKWELGYVPPLAEIKAALVAGFAETLGVTFEPAGLLDAAAALLRVRRVGLWPAALAEPPAGAARPLQERGRPGARGPHRGRGRAAHPQCTHHRRLFRLSPAGHL